MARAVGGLAVPILGVNLGDLGFLTATTLDEMLPAVEAALAGRMAIDERMLLSARLVRGGTAVGEYVALNDVVITKSAMSRIINLKVSVEGGHATAYRADGLIVSTPTGSTAYCLSAGGPILFPTMDAIVLVPIASHTLTNRPIVLPATQRIEVTLMTDQEVMLTIDGQVGIPLRERDVVEIETAAGGVGLGRFPGPGNSILCDAILLVRGARAQTDVIRPDAESATVEAVFAVPDGGVAAALDEAGLTVEEGEIVVRRELSRSGRHRAFVNDAAVTVGLLERLGDALVQVHGQHEHQRLLEPVRQLDLLDRFADAEPLRERFAALFAKHREAREDLERRRGAGRDRAQREDLLRFQVSELDAARLRPGEEEDLRTERRRLQHAERFAAGLEEVGELLQVDAASAAARLARATRVLTDLGRLDPAFGAPVEMVEAARVQVDETLAAVRALRDTIVFEPGRLEA